MDTLKSWLCGVFLAAGMVLLAAGLVGCGAAAERKPAMTMEEACRPVYPKEAPAVARVRRALKKPIDVAFDMMSLDKALKVISERVGVAGLLDPDVAAHGIDLSSRLMHFAVTGVPADEVLDLVLWDDLGYVVEADRILVTTRDMQEALPVFYPVADLVRSPDPNCVLAWQELEDILKRNVRGDCEAAAIEYFNGVFLIVQTPRGHQRILDILTMFRKALAQKGTESVSMPEPPGVKRIRRRMAERVDIDFENMSLLAILGFLQATLKDVNIVVDPGLAAVGLDLSCPVITLKRKQAPINEVLAKVLGQDLGYRIYPHYVLVTTQDRLQADLPMVMYPIRDIVKKAEDKFPAEQVSLVPMDRVSDVCDLTLALFDGSGPDAPAEAGLSGLFGGGGEVDKFAVGWSEIADIIKRMVNYVADPHVAPWADEGGPAAIDYFDGVLIITQTPEGHKRIAELLALLREAMARVERQLQE